MAQEHSRRVAVNFLYGRPLETLLATWGISPTCRQPVPQCTCRTAPLLRPVGDGVVRVSRETKGCGGKGVTLIKGVPLDGDALIALGKQLRTTCGTGGTVKDGAIELQGDHCERAIELLKQRGWQVKRVGGSATATQLSPPT